MSRTISKRKQPENGPEAFMVKENGTAPRSDNHFPPYPVVRFIKKHHVLTLATTGDDGPWCSNVFYAYIPSRNFFVFTSSDETRHGIHMLSSPRVAASIVLETRIVGRVQGLQLTGTVERVPPGTAELRAAYLHRFPYAAVADLELWLLHPLEMKLTDNTLGFGKKIVWVATDAG